jgi:hypothetical protein
VTLPGAVELAEVSGLGHSARVTDGLAVLAAWLMFGLLLLALVTVVLRGGRGHR